jgi:hypothetical protein
MDVITTIEKEFDGIIQWAKSGNPPPDLAPLFAGLSMEIIGDAIEKWLSWLGLRHELRAFNHVCDALVSDDLETVISRFPGLGSVLCLKDEKRSYKDGVPLEIQHRIEDMAFEKFTKHWNIIA